jgi:glycosyltransferase involved in cell wall biosynthesis
MKVLMISTDRKIFEEKSGVRQRVIEYGGLADELHIIIFSKKSLGFSKQKISENIWVYPTNSSNRLGYLFDAIKIGRKIVSGSDNWLVTTQDPFETGIVGWCVVKAKARAGGARLQLQIHTDFLSPYFAKGSVLNKVRVIVAKFLLPKADCVRVVSKNIVDSIKVAGIKLKKEPTVLPIFVDMEKIKNIYAGVDLHTKYRQFDTIILMVSRLEEEKNIPLAISVFRKIVDNYPKTGLIILGEGSQREALKSIVKNYNLENNTIFEGGNNEVLSFYKTADIFLHTSNYEGYGMVLVEAAVSDCPIVTTEVGIAGEYFEDAESAHICPVGDELCLVDRLIKIIENKEFRNLFALKAQNAIEEHIKEKNKEQYLARYKQLWEECLKKN